MISLDSFFCIDAILMKLNFEPHHWAASSATFLKPKYELTAENKMKALEIHWSETDACFTNSPPSAIYTFSLTDAKSLSHPQQEAWPSFFAMNMYKSNRRIHPVDLCGWLQVDINGFCCTSSLDTRRDGGTNGIKSGANILLPSFTSDQLVTKETIVRYAPSSINAASYCFLQSFGSSSSPTDTSKQSTQSVFGYESVMILASDPSDTSKCVDIEAYYDERVSFAHASKVQCLSNGTIVFYDASAAGDSNATGSCLGSPMLTYNLLGTNSSLTSAGSPTSTYSSAVTAISISSPSQSSQVMINAQFIRNVQNATTTIGWTSFEPNAYKVPVFKEWSEIVGMACMVIALIANVLRLYFLVDISRIRSRERVEYAIPFGLLVYTCLRMFLVYYTGTLTSQFVNWWVGIMGWVLGL